MTIRKVVSLCVILLVVVWGLFELYNYRFWFLTNKGAYELYHQNYDNAAKRLTDIVEKRGRHQTRAKELLVEALAQTDDVEAANMWLDQLPDSSWHSYMSGLLDAKNSSSSSLQKFRDALKKSADGKLSRERQKIAKVSVALLDLQHIQEDALSDYSEMSLAELPGWMKLDYKYATLVLGLLHGHRGDYVEASKCFGRIAGFGVNDEQLCLDVSVAHVLSVQYDKVHYMMDAKTTEGTVQRWSALRTQLEKLLSAGVKTVGVDSRDFYESDQYKTKLMLGIDLAGIVTKYLCNVHDEAITTNSVLASEYIAFLAKIGMDVDAWQMARQVLAKQFLLDVKLLMDGLEGKDLISDWETVLKDAGTTCIESVEFAGVPNDWHHLHENQTATWETETELSVTDSADYYICSIAKPFSLSWDGISLDIEISEMATNNLIYKDNCYFTIPYYTAKQVTSYLPAGNYRLKLSFSQTAQKEWLCVKELLILKKEK